MNQKIKIRIFKILMKKIKKKQVINKMILLFLIQQTKATADFYPKYNKKNQKVYAMKKTNLLKANEKKKYYEKYPIVLKQLEHEN